MDKAIRKAVRCYLIKEDKVLATKYKLGNKKGYFDIPGGKIEEGEEPKQAAIREMKEETGIDIKNLMYRGNIVIEYPNRIFDFDVFFCNECEGEPQEFEENESFWIGIKELLQKEKILSNIMILDKFFIKGLLNENTDFYLYNKVDEEENILETRYLYNKEEKK